MEDLLAKIYHSVIVNERVGNNVGKKYDEKFQMIIAQYKEKISEDEADKLQEILYDMAYITEQGGFALGVRFMARLINEIMSDEIQIADN